MSLLRITLDEDLHRALKETATRQDLSIATIVGELAPARHKVERVAGMVEYARRRTDLELDAALALAVKKRRAVRKQ